MSVTFSIVNDQIVEGMESFTAIISSDDQQVSVTVPNAMVVIADQDGV